MKTNKDKDKISDSIISVIYNIVMILIVIYIVMVLSLNVCFFLATLKPVITFVGRLSSAYQPGPDHHPAERFVRYISADASEGQRYQGRRFLGFLRPVRPAQVLFGIGIMGVKGLANRFRPPGARFDISNPLTESTLLWERILSQIIPATEFNETARATVAKRRRKEVFILGIALLTLLFVSYIIYIGLDKYLEKRQYNVQKKLDNSDDSANRKKINLK